ncbi:hypothetical protein HZC07_01255 [Candidatus Micrarchaeota archaeon]|nr:hypothetical protein [Candidatus Micrarchaeota archaeon]
MADERKTDSSRYQLLLYGRSPPRGLLSQKSDHPIPSAIDLFGSRFPDDKPAPTGGKPIDLTIDRDPRVGELGSRGLACGGRDSLTGRSATDLYADAMDDEYTLSPGPGPFGPSLPGLFDPIFPSLDDPIIREPLAFFPGPDFSKVVRILDVLDEVAYPSLSEPLVRILASLGEVELPHPGVSYYEYDTRGLGKVADPTAKDSRKPLPFVLTNAVSAMLTKDPRIKALDLTAVAYFDLVRSIALRSRTRGEGISLGDFVASAVDDYLGVSHGK